MISKLLLSLVLTASWLPFGPMLGDACAKGQQASVVVKWEDDTEKVGCFSVSEGSVDGVEALRRAGFEITTKSYAGLGEAVCTIDGQGSSANACPGASGHWHYWQLTDGAWKESDQGPSSTRVSAGSVEGWTWETDETNSAPRTLEVAGKCEPSGASRDAMSDLLPVASVIIGLAVFVTFAAVRRRKQMRS